MYKRQSLSRWFRDYVYIPLGGNRSGERRTYLNLYLVFALVGFWHGANWTFLVWGLYHGTLLVIERITGVGRTVRDRTNVFGRTVTMLLVIVGWVLFRATSIGQAGTILHLSLIHISPQDSEQHRRTDQPGPRKSPARPEPHEGN